MRLYILTLWCHKIAQKAEQENVPISAKLGEPSEKSVILRFDTMDKSKKNVHA